MHLIAAAEGGFAPIVIAAAAALLEDATTVAVGVLAADGHIRLATAAVGLAVGITIGDFALYGLGRLAVRHRSLLRLVGEGRIAPFKRWVSEHLTESVIVTRFLAGFRLPIYFAYGFLEVPLWRFMPLALLAALVWVAFLFGVSYFFGVYTFRWLGVWRWPLIALALLALFAFAHFHWNRIRARYAEEPGA